MKLEEKQRAIKLRKNAVAITEIARQLGVAKSSVSYWVRDVRLSPAALKRLKNNSHSVVAIEKRRVSRLRNTDQKRMAIKKRALESAVQLSRDPLWCVGVALYWGEGGKTGQTPRVANSDPAVIATMMKFFRKVCSVPEAKFRGHVHGFSRAQVTKAELYWSSVSGIPCSQFYKSYVKNSIASNNKRKTLPHGTFQIYIHDTDFFFTIMAWTEYLKKI